MSFFRVDRNVRENIINKNLYIVKFICIKKENFLVLEMSKD